MSEANIPPVPGQELAAPQQPQESNGGWVDLPPLSAIPVGGHSITTMKRGSVSHELFDREGEYITTLDARTPEEKEIWVTLPLPEDTIGQSRTPNIARRVGSVIKSLLGK